uniref:Uncharacterized protein n=1 Tax=Anopheles melas TaxID=34690 RepID=A0A182TZC3_9DIPT
MIVSVCLYSRCTFSAIFCSRSSRCTSCCRIESRSASADINRCHAFSSASGRSSVSTSTSPIDSKYFSSSLCCLSRCRGGTSSVRNRFRSVSSRFSSISVVGKARSCRSDVFSRHQYSSCWACSRYSCTRRCESMSNRGCICGGSGNTSYSELSNRVTPYSFSTTWKATSSRSRGRRDRDSRQSIRSGRFRWISAENAKPSRHELVKSFTRTPGYLAVERRAHRSSASRAVRLSSCPTTMSEI